MPFLKPFRKTVFALIFFSTLSATAYATEFFQPLTKALRTYQYWDAITAETYTSNKHSELRPDAPYLYLKEAMREVGYTKYPELKEWVNNHKDTLPAPLYLELAAKGMTMNSMKKDVPQEEYLKWYMVGSLLARYDLQQCTETGNNINATGVSLEYAYFQDMMSKDMVKAQAVMKDAYYYLKSSNYNASAMWACAHNKKTLAAIKKAEKEGETETGITKADLITDKDKLKMSWEMYIKQLGLMVNQ